MTTPPESPKESINTTHTVNWRTVVKDTWSAQQCLQPPELKCETENTRIDLDCYPEQGDVEEEIVSYLIVPGHTYQRDGGLSLSSLNYVYAVLGFAPMPNIDENSKPNDLFWYQRTGPSVYTMRSIDIDLPAIEGIMEEVRISVSDNAMFGPNVEYNFNKLGERDSDWFPEIMPEFLNQPASLIHNPDSIVKSNFIQCNEDLFRCLVDNTELYHTNTMNTREQQDNVAGLNDNGEMQLPIGSSLLQLCPRPVTSNLGIQNNPHTPSSGIIKAHNYKNINSFNTSNGVNKKKIQNRESKIIPSKTGFELFSKPISNQSTQIAKPIEQNSKLENVDDLEFISIEYLNSLSNSNCTRKEFSIFEDDLDFSELIDLPDDVIVTRATQDDEQSDSGSEAFKAPAALLPPCIANDILGGYLSNDSDEEVDMLAIDTIILDKSTSINLRDNINYNAIKSQKKISTNFMSIEKKSVKKDSMYDFYYDSKDEYNLLDGSNEYMKNSSNNKYTENKSIENSGKSKDHENPKKRVKINFVPDIFSDSDSVNSGKRKVLDNNLNKYESLQSALRHYTNITKSNISNPCEKSESLNSIIDFNELSIEDSDVHSTASSDTCRVISKTSTINNLSYYSDKLRNDLNNESDFIEYTTPQTDGSIDYIGHNRNNIYYQSVLPKRTSNYEEKSNYTSSSSIYNIEKEIQDNLNTQGTLLSDEYNIDLNKNSFEKTNKSNLANNLYKIQNFENCNISDNSFNEQSKDKKKQTYESNSNTSKTSSINFKYGSNVPTNSDISIEAFHNASTDFEGDTSFVKPDNLAPPMAVVRMRDLARIDGMPLGNPRFLALPNAPWGIPETLSIEVPFRVTNATRHRSINSNVIDLPGVASILADQLKISTDEIRQSRLSNVDQGVYNKSTVPTRFKFNSKGKLLFSISGTNKIKINSDQINVALFDNKKENSSDSEVIDTAVAKLEKTFNNDSSSVSSQEDNEICKDFTDFDHKYNIQEEENSSYSLHSGTNSLSSKQLSRRGSFCRYSAGVYRDSTRNHSIMNNAISQARQQYGINEKNEMVTREKLNQCDLNLNSEDCNKYKFDFTNRFILSNTSKEINKNCSDDIASDEIRSISLKSKNSSNEINKPFNIAKSFESFEKSNKNENNYNQDLKEIELNKYDNMKYRENIKKENTYDQQSKAISLQHEYNTYVSASPKKENLDISFKNTKKNECSLDKAKCDSNLTSSVDSIERDPPALSLAQLDSGDVQAAKAYFAFLNANENLTENEKKDSVPSWAYYKNATTVARKELVRNVREFPGILGLLRRNSLGQFSSAAMILKDLSERLKLRAPSVPQYIKRKRLRQDIEDNQPGVLDDFVPTNASLRDAIPFDPWDKMDLSFRCAGSHVGYIVRERGRPWKYSIYSGTGFPGAPYGIIHRQAGITYIEKPVQKNYYQQLVKEQICKSFLHKHLKARRTHKRAPKLTWVRRRVWTWLELVNNVFINNSLKNVMAESIQEYIGSLLKPHLDAMPSLEGGISLCSYLTSTIGQPFADLLQIRANAFISAIILSETKGHTSRNDPADHDLGVWRTDTDQPPFSEGIEKTDSAALVSTPKRGRPRKNNNDMCAAVNINDLTKPYWGKSEGDTTPKTPKSPKEVYNSRVSNIYHNCKSVYGTSFGAQGGVDWLNVSQYRNAQAGDTIDTYHHDYNLQNEFSNYEQGIVEPTHNIDLSNTYLGNSENFNTVKRAGPNMDIKRPYTKFASHSLKYITNKYSLYKKVYKIKRQLRYNKLINNHEKNSKKQLNLINKFKVKMNCRLYHNMNKSNSSLIFSNMLQRFDKHFNKSNDFTSTICNNKVNNRNVIKNIKQLDQRNNISNSNILKYESINKEQELFLKINIKNTIQELEEKTQFNSKSKVISIHSFNNLKSNQIPNIIQNSKDFKKSTKYVIFASENQNELVEQNYVDNIVEPYINKELENDNKKKMSKQMKKNQINDKELKNEKKALKSDTKKNTASKKKNDKNDDTRSKGSDENNDAKALRGRSARGAYRRRDRVCFWQQLRMCPTESMYDSLTYTMRVPQIVQATLQTFSAHLAVEIQEKFREVLAVGLSDCFNSEFGEEMAKEVAYTAGRSFSMQLAADVAYILLIRLSIYFGQIADSYVTSGQNTYMLDGRTNELFDIPGRMKRRTRVRDHLVQETHKEPEGRRIAKLRVRNQLRVIERQMVSMQWDNSSHDSNSIKHDIFNTSN